MILFPIAMLLYHMMVLSLSACPISGRSSDRSCLAVKKPSPCILQGDKSLRFVLLPDQRYAFRSSVSLFNLSCASSRLVPFTPM